MRRNSSSAITTAVRLRMSGMKAIISFVAVCCLMACASSTACAFSGGADSGETVRERRMQYRGFMGGMMLHTGYVRSSDLTIISPGGGSRTVGVAGMPFGIGGAIRFMFGEHLRIGAEGYMSDLRYGEYASHVETGWGGLLADCVWKVGKCRLFVGGTLGGGGQTSTVILSPVGDDYVAEEFVSYRKYSFAALAPFAGAEVPVSGKFAIVFKLDYLLDISNPQDDYVNGPRLYIGFMFGHSD